jgi:type II secretory pathway predicted ATPase ExeA
MYQNFYGLSEPPFELTAIPKYLFLSARHREALSTLQYGLFSAKALTVLIGDAGTGKTTLLQAALGSERCQQVRCIYLNNPVLRADEFIRLLALKFDLDPQSAGSKPLFLERLDLLLRERRALGETTALVIDEAQMLSNELLEEIRLLGNIETPAAKLLPLVLAGQPQLAARLEDPDLSQLKQRVTLRCSLEPFTLGETAAYIASRISTAGGVASQIFSREAVSLIHEYSGGIPRTISVICDNAMVSGMALGEQKRHNVERAIVLEVCRDLRLNKQAGREPIARNDAGVPVPETETAGRNPSDESPVAQVTPPRTSHDVLRTAYVPLRAGRMLAE